ncbi:hypothetical protein [Lacticaseibacillus rhamnosus]|uniref:hypothetical protein n=1 Tax=Lacticaseibacillus rhamnosus TaxID=47715 RepID=UPI001CDC8E69|nr:hypothetical protein [Lacticaseibacillus rhamnosus]WND13079.1 hypothetical protein RI131_07535 [Lacticaseibacillus rhamnosus]
MTGFLIKDFIIVKKRILKLPILISLFGAFLVAVFVNKDIAELFVFLNFQVKCNDDNEFLIVV